MVQLMIRARAAVRRTGNKLLSKPMMASMSQEYLCTNFSYTKGVYMSLSWMIAITSFSDSVEIRTYRITHFTVKCIGVTQMNLRIWIA